MPKIIKCYKCERKIMTEFNKKTNSDEYAEVFKEFKKKYYCDDCYYEVLK